MTLTRLQLALLSQTIENAYTHTLYSNIWSSITFTPSRIDELTFHSFPPITKQDLIYSLPAKLDSNDQIAYIEISSGTTGQCSYRVTTKNELTELSELTSTQTTDQTCTSIESFLQLNFYDIAHGHSNHVKAQNAIEIAVSASNPARTESAVRTYLNQYSLPRCTNQFEILCGSVVDILLFTRKLESLCLEQRPKPPRLIFVSASYLTAELRKYLSQFWNSSIIVEFFSVSEAKGGPVVCPDCRSLVTSNPLVNYTVLDLSTLSPVTSGSGLLAITEFYPLGKAQPIIKYLSGDVVKITTDIDVSEGCIAHVGKLKPLGRSSNCVILNLDGQEQVVISLLELIEVLSEFPLVLETAWNYLPLGDIKVSKLNHMHVISLFLQFRDFEISPVVIYDRLLEKFPFLRLAISKGICRLDVINDPTLILPLDNKRPFAIGQDYDYRDIVERRRTEA